MFGYRANTPVQPGRPATTPTTLAHDMRTCADDCLAMALATNNPGWDRLAGAFLRCARTFQGPDNLSHRPPDRHAA
jgi:hypothetical protein